jgi:hypothetical protein
MNPTVSHLATTSLVESGSALIDVVSALKGTSNVPRVVGKALLSTAIVPPAEKPNSVTNISPTTNITTRKKDSAQLKTSKGVYITKD